MRFDFSSFPFQPSAFSHRPMGLLDPEPKAMLADIAEIALIEKGSAQARAAWQAIQLGNLLGHAARRSGFWRKRIGAKGSDVKLDDLPVLTRQDVVKQVTLEGSLLQPSDGLATHTHATSGSTGVPVHFYVSEMNGRYNTMRSLAQYFMEGRDLSVNRTYVRQALKPVPNGFSVERHPSWLGALASVFKSGTSRVIEYLSPNYPALVSELKSEDIGYLGCTPRFLEAMFSRIDPMSLRDANIRMLMSRGESLGPELQQTFAKLNVPVRSAYSSEENGPIAFQCDHSEDHFHVATSNVVVEVVDRNHQIDGVRHGKVLVTHLHSYATPFIRYDLDDLACMSDGCPCGHAGPTIYNLRGRRGSLLKHRDGRLTEFHIRAYQLAKLVEFTEYRIRQTGFTKIVMEVGGRSELRPGEVAAMTEFLQKRAGPEFEIEVRPCQEIDWGRSVKRLGFLSEVG